jgi:hypothetical protein
MINEAIINMEEQYTFEEFDSFMKSMKKLSDILRSKKPDYIFAPITGSIPLIDVLSIIDRHFPIENVEYPPNSSRFIEREEIMDKWLSNFIKKNYFGKPISIVSVDEVISGSSVIKGANEFTKALYKIDSREKSPIQKKINYEILGIGEKPKSTQRNHGLSKLVNSNKLKVIETNRIITADNILLNPLRLERGEINRQGRQTYLPQIHSLDYSAHYISLLQNTANYFGVNLNNISLVNICKIKDSLDKYLSN